MKFLPIFTLVAVLAFDYAMSAQFGNRNAKFVVYKQKGYTETELGLNIKTAEEVVSVNGNVLGLIAHDMSFRLDKLYGKYYHCAVSIGRSYSSYWVQAYYFILQSISGDNLFIECYSIPRARDTCLQESDFQKNEREILPKKSFQDEKFDVIQYNGYSNNEVGLILNLANEVIASNEINLSHYAYDMSTGLDKLYSKYYHCTVSFSKPNLSYWFHRFNIILHSKTGDNLFIECYQMPRGRESCMEEKLFEKTDRDF